MQAYSTEIINPENRTGPGYFVQIKLKGHEPENYWFEFGGKSSAGCLTEDEKMALDTCLQMRVFYSEIEAVTLVARYAADRAKVARLTQVENFDSRM